MLLLKWLIFLNYCEKKSYKILFNLKNKYKVQRNEESLKKLLKNPSVIKFFCEGAYLCSTKKTNRF
jgi:hypothetical protein